MDLQVETMALKEFVLSGVCLLKKEEKTLLASKNVSVVNSNSSDPPNAGANERLLEKLEKENSLLRKDLQNKDVIVKTLIEKTTDLNDCSKFLLISYLFP